MKDNIEIGCLTKVDSFRLDRDQVMDPEKIRTNVSNFEAVYPITIMYT